MTRTCARMAALAASGLLAVPAGAAAAGPSLTEVLTTGNAGATPDLTLRASLPVSSTGQGTPQGRLAFGVDGRLLDAGAFAALVKAPAGTQIGYVMTDLTGSTRQLPLKKLAVTGSGKERAVSGTIDTPSELASALGPTIPVLLQQAGKAAPLTLRIDLQAGQQKALGAGSAYAPTQLAVTFFGSWGGHPFIRVPQATTAVRSTLTARACAGTSCTLASGESDSATVTLPKGVALSAPATATYGRPVKFEGSRFGNDSVELWVQEGRGIYLQVRNPQTIEREPGLFTIYAPLRSIFNATGALVQPATGRYLVADTDRSGKVVVLAAAANDTSVHVATPALRIHHVGQRVRVWVTVPGGNDNFTVTLKLGARRVATGRLNNHGQLTTLIPRPAAPTVLRVFAHVRGAATGVGARPLS